jgi:Zn-dependent protease with chaperone function
MRTVPAKWFDGRTSERRLISISGGGDSIQVRGEGVEMAVPLREVRIDPPLGNARRMIRFPGGEIAETDDHRFLDALARQQGSGGFFRSVHRWENSLKRAFLALLITLLAGFGFVRYGIPSLATQAALAMPEETETLLGRETLQILDRMVLEPTRLPPERRKELTDLFATVAAARPEGRKWRLEFRSGKKVGANAFALPSGIVIVTDRLVEIAKSDDEIASVLAHEIGHVTRRHALRHLMQNSATALIVATVTGDITSVSSLSATLPTVLIDAKYSRDFEREADDAAVAYLKSKGLPVKLYAEMLRRLEADHDREPKTAKGLGELFSSHPETGERIQRVMGGEH